MFSAHICNYNFFLGLGHLQQWIFNNHFQSLTQFTACYTSFPFCRMSSLTPSVHLFLCLLCLFEPDKNSKGMVIWSRLSTWHACTVKMNERVNFSLHRCIFTAANRWCLLDDCLFVSNFTCKLPIGSSWKFLPEMWVCGQGRTCEMLEVICLRIRI